jgi:phenylalanyl-tRNA synthetase alpha chain
MEKNQIQQWVLETLDKESIIPDTLALKHNGETVNQLEVLGVLNALKSRNMIEYESLVIERWVLTSEGKSISDTGSHEARVYHAVPAGSEGISIADLTELVGDCAKFGQGAAFKLKWISKTANGKLVRNVRVTHPGRYHH